MVRYTHWDERDIKVMIVTIQFITGLKSLQDRTHIWRRIGYLTGYRHGGKPTTNYLYTHRLT